MDNLKLELRKLGLTEKEVEVYLAGLELGPTSVQEIASEVEISRPTVYKIIEQLQDKDLFTKLEEDNKTYYVAQSPDHLLGVLETKKKELEEREREFVRIIAALKSKYLLEDQGEIKLYKGDKGLETIQEELSHTSTPEFFVLSSEFESSQAEIRKEIYQKAKKRLGEIKVKEIYPEENSSAEDWLKRKKSEVDLKGTLILTDRVVFIPEQDKAAMLIENKLILEMLKVMFKKIWDLS